MHRIVVALLAAIDAAIAAAVTLAVIVAPATLIWVLGFGASASWGALWPTSATIWQFGHLVPLQLQIPGDYLAETGISPAAAAFPLSLAPLAFTAFTAIFAARSGARSARSGAWASGVTAGAVVFGGLSALIALTGSNSVAGVSLWQAIAFPTLVFTLPALIAAIVREWIDAESGVVASIRDRIEAAPSGWDDVAGEITRGAAFVCVGMFAAGSLLVVIALIASGGDVVALYQAGNLDVLGASVLTLGQLAYLPTVVMWAIAFLIGPGFALGTGTAVSAAGTQVGVLPPIPLLGIIPDSPSIWLLLLALVPVGLGVVAGAGARARIAPLPGASAAPRAVLAGGIAVVVAVAMSMLAALASGSIGPGSLMHVGPDPGPIALVVGIEVLIGAGITLLAPRRE